MSVLKSKIVAKIHILNNFWQILDQLLTFRESPTFTSMGTIFDNFTEVVLKIYRSKISKIFMFY